ncbi:hypothetical protein JCM16303_006142 [Sporobolomyces ruberrimus]
MDTAGIIKLKLPLSQLFLGIWYLTADAILGTELLLWGHPGRLAPKPTPAKTLIKKREMEHKHKWILNFDRMFELFTLWDNTKVVVSCIFFGATWWGIYFVSMLYQSGGSFKVEVPTSHPTLALVLGVLATALFTAARFPEIIEGEMRHRKKERPTVDLSDGVFVFLVIENLFNLGSIFVLALDPSLDKDGLRTKYLMGELPWILGGVIPIMTDAYLIVRIYQWQKAWAKTSYSNEPDKKAEISKVQIDIERAEAGMNELKERKENIEVGIAAFDHHKKVQEENEKRVKGKWTDGVRQRVRRPKKPKTSSLLEDYHANKSALDTQYPSESRKARQGLAWARTAQILLRPGVLGQRERAWDVAGRQQRGRSSPFGEPATSLYLPSEI